ncbi:MAG: hypothetical protein QOK15_2310 [Nocardioidaceae bacterium]|nr:hypothetical protein [Nocardioidaceae bacterium]
MQPTTFPRLLADQCARAGSRPLVTFYDDATAERVELSVVTYANWVAKTAGLLQDELGLERGGTLVLDLPTHWLGPVVLGAAWSVGLAVTPETSAAATADAVVCGPAGVQRYAGGAAPVVAVSLRPLGAPFAVPLPPGVVDHGAVVWGQPDAFLALDEPEPDDPAWVSSDRRATQAELVAASGSGPWSAPGTRLLTDALPGSWAGVEALLGPLLAGGGTVWVTNPDPRAWDHRARAEQATVRAPGQPRS